MLLKPDRFAPIKATLDKHGKQVRFAIGNVRLCEFLQRRIHAFAAHIRRIRHHSIKLHPQNLRLLHQWQQIQCRRLSKQVAALDSQLQTGVHRRQLRIQIGWNLNQRAEGFGMGKGVDQWMQS